ncbi:MAG: hypothetical protein JW843_07285 [Candidatus Aminicenantes bacterium]|nr:hypothetical protein [Candidatus Aminicenantes bacterium]
MGLGSALMRYLTAPPVPSTAFHLGPGYLGGLRRSRKTGSVKGSVLRPVSAGILEFSFDRPNIVRPEAFLSIVKDSVRRLGGTEGPAALLLPETCVKTALLSFESLPAGPEEREKVVRWKLQKTLPLAGAETRLSFAVHQAEDGAKAFCVVAREAVVQEYEQVLAKAGLSVRLIGIPTPALLGCLPRNGASSFLVVNVERDHFAALAVIGGEPFLFRVKPLSPDTLWAEAADETAATIRFLEEREKTRIETVWLRPAGGGESGVSLIQEKAGRRVRTLPGDAPSGLPPDEKISLAALLGYLS